MGKLSENRKKAGRERRALVLRLLADGRTEEQIGILLGPPGQPITRQRINQLAQKGRRDPLPE